MNTNKIDTQSAQLIEEISADFEKIGGTTELNAVRRDFKRVQMSMADYSAHKFDGTITDSVMQFDDQSVPVRTYVPVGVRHGAGVAYFHGGGWVFGDLDTADRFTRAIARTLKVTVISVDYRLAPEHPFPAGLNDCMAVANYARAEFGTWCAVAGDSAGGNLAASVALAAGADSKFDAQLLLYPCLDVSMGSNSYSTFSEGFGLTRDAMSYYWDVYGGLESAKNPLLSPMAADDLAGLPPTVLVTAGFDPLFDEGRSYAERLIQAGVATTYLPYLSLPHGFIETVDRVKAASKAVSEILASFKAFAFSP